MSESTRVADATPVLIRHVRRARTGESAMTVLRADFHAVAGPELDAFNGPSGWQNAQASAALADDGELVVTFPNVAGDDGILHRQRFALLTDPLYRAGEEWLEVYREPVSQANLLGVWTPTRWRLDRGHLELRGPDLLALFTLARASELDVWHHAPRDAFDFYTRLPASDLAADLTGWSATGTGTALGWTYAGLAAPGGPAGARIVSTDPAVVASLQHPLSGVQADAYEAAARLLWETGPDVSVLQEVRLVLDVGGGDTIEVRYIPSDGKVDLQGHGMIVEAQWRAAGRTQQTKPGDCSLRVLVRREWVYAFLAGELVAHGRRRDITAPASIRVEVRNASVVAQRVDVHSPAPFALRGTDKGDLQLPGAPTAGGLRGRYYNEAATASVMAGFAGLGYLAGVLDDLTDPADSRLDPTLDFASGTGWQPAAAQPASGAWAARWTGAIYLDLSGHGRRVRLAELDGAARVWIGRTYLPADAIIDAWQTAAGARSDLRSANLQPLGPSGWYPIVVELANDGGACALRLQESPLDAGGDPTSWQVVPAARLSPFGCYEQEVRGDSHRELLATITQTFGYQWRVDPRTLESGEFPGQVIPRVRVGEDTDRVVTADRATELASEGDATDAVDRLLIDAAGLADPKAGTDNLTADVVNDEAVAAGHLFLSTGSESLPDVSEPNLLAQRADSLLALKATPNEQIATRPLDAGQELTDTFPLTGALARRRWRPGDGLRLALEDLSVIDATPRQLLAVQWPLWRDGTGIPTVGWRQRPRGLRAFLRRTARVAFVGQRSPQGQTGILLGSLAASTGDPYSRAPLPDNLDDVVDAAIIVAELEGDGRIEVNDIDTGIAVSDLGRYPLRGLVARDGAARPRMRMRLIGAGLVAYEAHVELRIRI